MKKTTSLIMVLVLILSMLWGCGQADGTVVTVDSSGKGKTTLHFFANKWEENNVRVMEELITEFMKENKDIKERKNGGWFVDGQCPIYDFLEYFEIDDETVSNNYNTISGLILEILQHIPLEGESIKWKNLNIEIIDMDGARIDKIIVKKI